jgi:hypothetical protein
MMITNCGSFVKEEDYTIIDDVTNVHSVPHRESQCMYWGFQRQVQLHVPPSELREIPLKPLSAATLKA